MDILIYTDHPSPRLQYVLNYIFRDCFRQEFSVTDQESFYTAQEGVRINYSGKTGMGGFRIPVSGLLAEDSVRPQEVRPETSGDIPMLFVPGQEDRPDHGANLPFDVFAAVFYMITRYEEYLPFQPDQHGRFEAENSLAMQHNFLHLPVVDLWVKLLRKRLTERFTGLTLFPGKFAYQPTSDIDLPFAILHRGMLRTVGANIRSSLKRNGESKMRRAVLSGEVKDPFDTFDEMGDIHMSRGLRPIVFFLTSGYGRYDKSISPNNETFQELIDKTMQFGSPALHPSYRSASKPSILQKEIRTLSSLTGREIQASRQHYLKFNLPTSYRQYMQAGIKEEYSMGYASFAGFRAGTSKPFNFYDLEQETETPLRIIPFQVMDRTLKDYMNLTPASALLKIKQLVDAVRMVEGTFVSIWHNDAFSDHGEWEGWKEVYLQMLDYIK
jgi:hypothetical protein